jgi:hypothetical protein
LKDDNNQWVWEDGKLQRMATEFYQKLFTEEDLSMPDMLLYSVFPELDNLSKNQLTVTSIH